MSSTRAAAIAAGLCLTVFARAASAQIDYRNLDGGRPVAVEDAYPIERHAFELLVPYSYAREAGGEHVSLFPLEVEYGAFDNAEIGLEAPVAGVDAGPGADTDWGLAGLGAFALYNFNTESRTLPAFAVRGDLSLPVGSLAGDAARVGLTAIATRSWGRSRFHFNATRSFGSEDGLGAVETLPRSSYGLAVDRTLFRQSILLVGGVTVSHAVRDARTEVTAGVGGRYQLSPTLVVDAGVSRRLRADVGPDFAFTFGLSHAFGFGWLMPARP
jgi:hypothetical protein